MTAAVIAIVVAAVLTAFFLGLNAVVRRLSHSEERTARERLTGSLMEKKYAYILQRARGSLFIENMDGDSTLTRGLIGVRAPEGLTVEHITGTLTASGDFEGLPKLRRKKGPRYDRITFEARESKVNGQYVVNYDVHFTDGLRGNDEVDVEIEAKIRNSHQMTRAAVHKKYAADEFKNEYHGIWTAVPAAELELEVRFPKEFARSVTAPVVFDGESETEVREETNRVKQFFETGEDWARLVVKNPQITYQYAIYWVPSH